MKMLNENSVVRPINGRCVVDLDVEDLYTDPVTANEFEVPKHVRLYKGKVAESSDPALEGKYVTLSEFSGNHLAYSNKLAKLVPITDLLTINDQNVLDMENKEFDITDLTPVPNKVLVEVLINDKDDLTLDDDPRVSEMLFAKVLKVGEGCVYCKQGDIIGIDPYDGEVVVSQPTEYRVLLDPHIKLIIEK